MSTRRRTRHGGPARPGRSRSAISRWRPVVFGAALLLVAIAAVVLIGRARGESGPSSSGFPGPIGGRDIAQDVGTLVGKRAPAFTLQDSEGVSYQVTPGRGRPLVLVSHMGIT